MNTYFVYFMSNETNTTIYVGVTNNLERRVFEHKNSINQNSFTSKYRCYKLVWFEEHNDINEAIAKEKKIKNWKREWKVNTIEILNPNWLDLAIDWKTYE